MQKKLKILQIMAVILFAVSGTVYSNSGRAQSAISSYLEGDNDTAISLLEGVLRDEPLDQASRSFLSKIYLEKITGLIEENNLMAARAVLRKLITLDSSNPDIEKLRSLLDSGHNREEMKSAVTESGNAAVEELKKNAASEKKIARKESPGKSSEHEIYKNILEAIEKKDSLTRQYMERTEKRIFRSETLYPALFIIIGMGTILPIIYLVFHLRKSHRRFLFDAEKTIADKINALRLNERIIPALEEKKIRNINIIDAEFSDETELQTGGRLLEEYLNDENIQVRSRAVLALGKYDRGKALEMVWKIFSEKNLQAADIIISNVSDYQPEFAAEVLLVSARSGLEEILPETYAGIKKIIKNKMISPQMISGMEDVLKEARKEGWVI